MDKIIKSKRGLKLANSLSLDTKSTANINEILFLWIVLLSIFTLFYMLHQTF